MKIYKVKKVTSQLIDAMALLIPQLSLVSIIPTAENLTSIVDSDSTNLFVVEKDEKIIGIATLVIYTIPTGKKAIIEDVIVDLKNTGKGYGKLLLATLIEYAKNEDVTKIELTSNPTRVAANAMYQKAGFEIRQTNYYRKTIDLI